MNGDGKAKRDGSRVQEVTDGKKGPRRFLVHSPERQKHERERRQEEQEKVRKRLERLRERVAEGEFRRLAERAWRKRC